MIVNTRLDIGDGQRAVMAKRLGVAEKMVTRKQVNSFVQGCIDYITNPDAAQTTHNTSELGEAERLRAEGYDESYIRGWLQVGERYGLKN